MPKSYATSSIFDAQTLEKPNATVHYVIIPPMENIELIPVVSDKLDLLPKLVESVKGNAVVAINAGFFDPKNQMTTSYVVIDGKVAATPIDNRDFLENPAMYPYLEKMLNRTEFRIFKCKHEYNFTIGQRMQRPKGSCKFVHSIQAGPNLFEPDSTTKEAFVDFNPEGKCIRDPLGVNKRNARSAIGIDASGNAIIAMVSMKPNDDGLGGVTLTELASIMKELGAQQAMALDGGSSSTLWVNGKTLYGKLNADKKQVQRPIKSAFVVVKK